MQFSKSAGEHWTRPCLLFLYFPTLSRELLLSLFFCIYPLLSDAPRSLASTNFRRRTARISRPTVTPISTFFRRNLRRARNSLDFLVRIARARETKFREIRSPFLWLRYAFGYQIFRWDSCLLNHDCCILNRSRCLGGSIVQDRSLCTK